MNNNNETDSEIRSFHTEFNTILRLYKINEPVRNTTGIHINGPLCHRAPGCLISKSLIVHLYS